MTGFLRRCRHESGRGKGEKNAISAMGRTGEGRQTLKVWSEKLLTGYMLHICPQMHVDAGDAAGVVP